MKKNILLILCILNLFLMSTNVFADGYNYNGYSGNLPIEDDYDSFYRDWVSRKIIGSDDRYTVKNPHVYPYTAVCLIEAKQNGKVISSGTAGNNGTNYNFGLPLTVSRTATFLLGDSGFTPGGDDGFQPEP